MTGHTSELKAALIDALNLEAEGEIPAKSAWVGKVPLADNESEISPGPKVEWSFFALEDVALVSGFAFVSFRWLESSSPPLTYILPSHVGYSPSHLAATLIMHKFRVLLRPGWREGVTPLWLDQTHAVITPKVPTRSGHHEQIIRRDLDMRWSGSQPGAARKA